MHTRHHSSVSPRKSSRHASSSSTPLSSLDQSSTVHSGAHSLAHELAVALMPEPSGASRLLAEEFGIEYDEGAEGIDEDLEIRNGDEDVDMLDTENDGAHGCTSLADEFGGEFGDSYAEEVGDVDEEHEDALNGVEDGAYDGGRDRGSDDDDSDDDATRRATLAHDAMEILAQNLASTDKFLAHLRATDMPPPSPSHTKMSFTAAIGNSTQTSNSSTFTIEGLASDTIRRINEAVREREGQLRELIACDRDFKRISGEVGGADLLGDLEPLEDPVNEDESCRPPHAPTKLDSVMEEDEVDLLYNTSLPSSPQKTAFASSHSAAPHPSAAKNTTTTVKPLAPSAIPSMAVVIPSLSSLRVHTSSLLSSLTTISEQSQVNGAATADAGRKIRSLKNRLGGWKSEWEGAERSRTKIERWEIECKAFSGGRIDGRAIVAEHMRAFEKAIAEAGMKTQAIMAR